MELKVATRKSVKLKLNISAPSGAGKTMSALRLAYGLTGDWTKIGLIDTENGSASLYSHLGKFNTLDMQPPFTPEKYIQAIDICEKAGMELVIIDSSTHEWITLCAENEILANTAFRGNTWAAWSKSTPRHDAFVNKVLHTPMHFITCTRSKTETVQEGGKIKKLGMKDQQRDGWEYELTVSLEIDRDTHFATPSKDRTELFEGKQPFLITEETGQLIKDWCLKGVVEKTSEEKLKECANNTELAMIYKSLPSNEQVRLKDLATELKAKLATNTTPSASTEPTQDRPSMPDDRYKKLITSLKKANADITGILRLAREQFTFNADQEKEFNTIIAAAAAKKQAA